MYSQLQLTKEFLISFSGLTQFVVSKESDNLILSCKNPSKCIYKINMSESNIGLEALDLGHPLSSCLIQLSKYHRKYTDGLQSMVSEESVMDGKESSSLKESDRDEDVDGCLTLPSVQDNFQPYQLKSKNRRTSLPPRFRMNDNHSQIICTTDNRTDLEKLMAIARKLNQIYTKEELAENCRVCKRDLLISEVSPQGIAVSYTHLTLPTIYSV